MITVQQVITLMEQLAPRSYAESWDNVGLMVGDRNVVVTGVSDYVRRNRRNRRICY